MNAISRSVLFSGVLAALCLLGAVGWSSLGLERAARGLVAAEAAEWTPRAAAYPATAEGLARMVADHPHLHWVGYAHPGGEVTVEAGGPRPSLSREGGPVRALADGSVLAFGPPPRHLAQGWAGAGPPPPLAAHFTPTLSERLIARSRASLAVALLAASLLVLGSVWLARTLERAQAAQNELQDSEHLAQMGEMSAVLAHEIRNPLASLKGHAQLLEELLDGSPHQRRAHRVVGEAVRLQELVDALLAYARRAEIRRRDVDVREMLDELYADKPQVVVAVPEDLRWSLDRALVQRSVHNLVTNALQAGGEAPVDLQVRVSGARLCFAVRDRGPGLEGKPPEELFVPFATTRTRGTGLGLAIAARIARAHGGTVRAEDHPEGGALFTLEIGAE